MKSSMPSMTTDEVARQLGAISSLPREVLMDQWTRAYGRPPPKSIGRGLLERAAAYRLQVGAAGGLPTDLKRRLARLARADDVAIPSELPRSPVRLSPGTRLVREWNGRTHVVEVTDGGFLWNERAWSSLSAVAKAITGARWSGPRFFGL
jgi:hypothetical protein